MDNFALISAKPPLIPTKQHFFNKPLKGSLFISKPISKTALFAFSTPNSTKKLTHNIHISNNNNNITKNDRNIDKVGLFTSISTAKETNSFADNYPSSQFGSPLFWIGVGVGFSALFSFGASWLKKYATQQAYKTMMSQMGAQNNQFSNTAFPSGSPFGSPPPSTSNTSTFPSPAYQPPSTSGPSTFSSSAPRQATPPSPVAPVTVDASAKKPELTEPVVNDETKTKTQAKQSAFVDISPDETLPTSPFENYDDASSWRPSEAAKFPEVVQNEPVSNEGTTEWSQETRKSGSSVPLETLEKMMEDPNIQKMIFPHLPEDMRNPDTIKWMLQNPLYRQQLQQVLDNMGQGAVDSVVLDKLKSFDLNNPEIRQQFDQVGLTPEEAMSRIMASPDIVRAFQNPRIQQAILDVSQNPMNMMKYQNDKEVMDAFNKMQELFPES